MKTNLDSNGWVLHIDEDIKSLSIDQIHEIGRLINKHLVVTFKNQELTEDDEVNFCSAMGKIHIVPVDNLYGTKIGKFAQDNGISYVTGKIPGTKKPGLFGHKETLDWHTHQVYTGMARDAFTYLYSKYGSKGSRTSWINFHLAYDDLEEEIKIRLKKIKFFTGHKNDSFTKTKMFPVHTSYIPISIIHTNIEGVTGLYFPFLQIMGADPLTIDIDEWKELYDFLVNHVTQEKYIYHHNWEDKDVVVFEQWLSIHKRWECDQIEERMLHRIAFHYDHIYGSKTSNSWILKK